MGSVLDWKATLEGSLGSDLGILETRHRQFTNRRTNYFLLGLLVDLPESDVVTINCDKLSIFPLAIKPIHIDQTFLNLRAPQGIKLMLMSLKLRTILKSSTNFLFSLGAVKDDDPASSIPNCKRLAFIIKF